MSAELPKATRNAQGDALRSVGPTVQNCRKRNPRAAEIGIVAALIGAKCGLGRVRVAIFLAALSTGFIATTAHAPAATVTVPSQLTCTIINYYPPRCSDTPPWYSHSFGVGIEYSTSSVHEWRALMKFDVVSYVPPGNQILSAEIRAPQGYPDDELEAHSRNVYAHRLLKPWTGGVSWQSYNGSATWDTAGGDFGPAVAAAWICCRTAPGIWDITSLARDWLGGQTPNYGVILESPTRLGYMRPSFGDPLLHITYGPARPVLSQGGDLFAGAHQNLTGEAYEHSVYAEPGDDSTPGVGIRRIEVFVDGQSQASRGGLVEQDCPQPSCDAELDWDFRRENYTVGTHTIRTVATDWAGNSSSSEFSVYLSATRTAEPTESASFGGASLRLADATSQLHCGREVAPAGDAARAESIANRTSLGDRAEATVRYDDRTYFVAKCNPSGELIEAQHVAPTATPDGLRMLIASITKPVPGSDDEYVTTSFTYPAASDPAFIADWRHRRDRIVGPVLPPTPLQANP